VGGAPVAATVIVGGMEAEKSRGDFSYPERLTRISVRRSEVPSRPSGSRITVGATTYSVDETESADAEILRVLAR
jgi:hypothetical protein